MRTTRHVLMAVLALLLTASGTALSGIAGAATPRAASPSWAQDGYGPGNTGYNPDEPDLNAGTVGSLRYRWSLTAYGDGETDEYCRPDMLGPIIAGGRAFVSDGDGYGAFDADTGEHLWGYGYEQPYDEVVLQIGVVGGLAVFAIAPCPGQGDLTKLLAYDTATGEEVWNSPVGVRSTSMVIDKGTVVVAGYDGRGVPQVEAVRARDGSYLWGRADYLLSAGASATGRVLLTRAKGKGALAVAVASGAELWKTGKAWTAQAANPAGDRFYVTDPAGTLLAVKASTGATTWAVAKAGGKLSADGRRVYVARARSLSAYDAARGRKVWRKAQASTAGRPIRAGGLLYCVIAASKPMAVLNAANGVKVVSGAAYRTAVGHPVVAGGKLYINYGGKIVAYGL
ncbi:PQQ-binding-like beta-propeller repeat protein [Actinoplanes sp. NPDC051475]|uniref:outer membrane protein assembly factor BamB family protein n=1 Tax=Actinoplanes sp. NPDC051475 TaxID=3157225 RepID=UPI00344C800C